MATPKYLALIATAIETVAGASTTSNTTPAGYWKRIALAAEVIAGAASTANDTLTGWQKRAAVAIAVKTGISSSGYNADEAGYLAWMVSGLEFLTGITTTGSLEKRLYDLIPVWVPVILPWPAPVLTQTSAATVNPLEWDSDFTGYIVWDGSANGDKQLMRWRRVNGGAWTTEAEQGLDDELISGGFTWPLWEAAKSGGSLPGGYIEVQEQRVRYSGGVELLRSAWSNAIVDNLAAPAFVPSTLFGAGDVGYAFDTTDGSKVFSNVGGTTAGVFGNPVGKLIDISGKGNNLTAVADDTTRPTWTNTNNGVITFDGSNDKLLGVGGFYAKGAMTWCGFVKAGTQTSFLWAENSGLSGSTSPVYAPGLRGDTAALMFNYQRNDANTALQTAMAAALLDGNGHIYFVEDTGTQLTLWVDGTQTATAAYSRNAPLSGLGSTFGVGKTSGGDFGNFNGVIGSPTVIGRLLTGTLGTAGTEKTKLYNYIAAKHGLATL
jgi:hypothetical protein